MWIVGWEPLGSYQVTSGTKHCWEFRPAGSICHLLADLWPSEREVQLSSLPLRLLFIFLLQLQPFAKDATELKNTLGIESVEAQSGSAAADGADINDVDISESRHADCRLQMSEEQRQPVSHCVHCFASFKISLWHILSGYTSFCVVLCHIFQISECRRGQTTTRGPYEAR